MQETETNSSRRTDRSWGRVWDTRANAMPHDMKASTMQTKNMCKRLGDCTIYFSRIPWHFYSIFFLNIRFHSIPLADSVAFFCLAACSRDSYVIARVPCRIFHLWFDSNEVGGYCGYHCPWWAMELLFSPLVGHIFLSVSLRCSFVRFISLNFILILHTHSIRCRASHNKLECAHITQQLIMFYILKHLQRHIGENTFSRTYAVA